MEDNGLNFILLFLLIAGLAVIFALALNKSFQNQDRMLCESVKISGNREYLEKCECYYETEDIKGLQK